ncbi:hypothetical protein [Orenia marismortui]|uniref:Flagellar assembly T-like protein n=1 Tax=Orenia marismortui TaxID=46469 RepID=A0A4R8GYM8_9FIRM|nr:hypothetical protein [Orenia marismortui]TDX51622.1 flagellar assembly T-like protein [Orenia marismortui]
MRKIVIILCLFIVIVITNGVYADNNDIINKKLADAATNLFDDIKLYKGYVVKIEQNKVYINLGYPKVERGDKFTVIKEGEVLKDPITQNILGKIEMEVSEIRIDQVRKDYSRGENIDSFSKLQVEVGDKVIANKLRKLSILNLNKSDKFAKLSKKLLNYFESYLKTGQKIKLSKSDELKKLVEGLELKEELNQDDIDLIIDKLKLDFLMTFDISEVSNSILIYIQLYSKNPKAMVKEELITISKDNRLIKYYLNQSNKDQLRLIHQSEALDLLSSSLAVGDINNDSQAEIILNSKDSLKSFTYQTKNLIEGNTIDNYKRTKYDDYKLVIGDLRHNGRNEIFFEGFNQLFNLEWNGEKYENKLLEGFSRNRPKAIVKLNNKKYLITRDYRNKLKFNIWQDNKYKTDFELTVKNNEGYRVVLGDIDHDKEKEVVLTAYGGEGTYRIKVYDLSGSLEYTFPQNYNFPMAIVGESKELLLVSNSAQNTRIISFIWDGDNYVSKWKTKSFAGEIKDIIVCDIDNDNREEIIVLEVEDKKSRIYIYQRDFNKR